MAKAQELADKAQESADKVQKLADKAQESADKVQKLVPGVTPVECHVLQASCLTSADPFCTQRFQEKSGVVFGAALLLCHV